MIRVAGEILIHACIEPSIKVSRRSIRGPYAICFHESNVVLAVFYGYPTSVRGESCLLVNQVTIQTLV